MAPDNEKYLGVYLEDHYAGATAGAALAERIASAHAEDTAGVSGSRLRQLAADIDADRDALRALMASVGVEPSTAMNAVAAAAERIERLKPNGQLVGRSPLTDVVEFESMRLGVAGKLSCWRALRELAAHDARMSKAALDELIDRAVDQTELLDVAWRAAVNTAFVRPPIP